MKLLAAVMNKFFKKLQVTLYYVGARRAVPLHDAEKMSKLVPVNHAP